MQAVGLRTYIWNNVWKSALLLSGFPLLLAMMTFGLALIVADDGRGFREVLESAIGSFPYFLAAGWAVALVWFGIAWVSHQQIIDLVTGARAVTRPEEPRLWNLLETLCISRGMTMPRLAVIETSARNAFASGLSREAGAVTVTRGLMEALDDRELAAVLAHEVTHIRNGDARLAVIAAIFAGVISLVAEMLVRSRRPIRHSWSSRSSSRSRRSAGMVALIGVALIVLAYVLATVLRMTLSRNREFLADAGAVELTQDPDAMIGALRKVAGHSEMQGVPSQVRAMFLDDTLGQRFGGLLATHPTIEARIEALVRYGGGRDPGPAAMPVPADDPPGGGTPVPAPGSPWSQ